MLDGLPPELDDGLLEGEGLGLKDLLVVVAICCFAVLGVVFLVVVVDGLLVVVDGLTFSCALGSLSDCSGKSPK